MTTVNRIPFNTIPRGWAFDREVGPFIREILTIIWQERIRTGGDSDSVANLLARMAQAETDIDAIEADITALEAVDVALDARIDALEANPGAYAATVEHNFGTDPVYDASFTITDAEITPTSIISVVPGGAATGRTADDWQWDGATIGVTAATGTATCYVTFHPGPIVGPRSFNYSVV